MGRMWGDKRITNSVTNQTTYAYNLDGSLATLTYPSGRIISYTYNSAAQPTAAADNANEISYVSGGLYAPHGALAFRTSGVNYTILYNSRLQPCWSWAGSGTSLPLNDACTATATTGTILDLKYSYNLGADNGDVVGITNDQDTTRSQTFLYDSLNRISRAYTSSTYSNSPANCWGELFNYDQWGNFLSIGVSSSAYTGCNQQSLNVLVNGSNQISSPSGYVYDADGNLITVPAPGAASYSYNAENEMTSTAGVNYIYDGDGHRVEKSNGKLYWYGNAGKVLEETDLSGNLTSEYVFFGGTRVARRDSPSNNIFYYFGDQLGTSRAIVQSGQTSPCYDADFFPFGGEHALVNTCPQNYKFTGKERDSESNLDNFEARYYSSQIGRMQSPDPLSVSSNMADSENPQSWNMYSYVLNNPLSATDPDGLDCIYTSKQTSTQIVVTIVAGDCLSETDNGIYVDGTINENSLTYDGSSVGFSFSNNEDQTGGGGVDYVGSPAPANSNSDQLSPYQQQVLGQAGQMADAGIKLDLILVAPEYLAATGGVGLVALSGGTASVAGGIAEPAIQGIQKLAELVQNGQVQEAEAYIRALSETPAGQAILREMEQLLSKAIGQMGPEFGGPEALRLFQDIKAMIEPFVR